MYRRLEKAASRRLRSKVHCALMLPQYRFISNRLLMPYINEAVIALETGVASKEDIDTTMKLGMNHPSRSPGPLTSGIGCSIENDLLIPYINVLQWDRCNWQTCTSCD